MEKNGRNGLQNIGSEQLLSLIEFMKENELDWDNAREDNAHGWARHWRERSITIGEHELPNCTVYEYRNLEHEQLHFDVFECRLTKKCKLYFEKEILAFEVSKEENCFDAS